LEFRNLKKDVNWDKVKFASYPLFPKADVLVLAGDICKYNDNEIIFSEFLKWAKQKYQHVIFVAGNHEYYGCDKNMLAVDQSLEKLAEETKTIFLNRSSVIIEGKQYLGCTLWSLIDRSLESSFGDFYCNVFSNYFQYQRAFWRDFNWLDEELKKPLPEGVNERIIITHHLPTRALINERHNSPTLNTGFYTEILHELNLAHVSTWICGHTHETKKYISSSFATGRPITYLVNPVGYPGEARSTKIIVDIICTGNTDNKKT